MEENIAYPVIPGTPINPLDVVSTQIVEEGPRVCPLCSSEIKFFFINFNEKMLMCENIECEFPFGYEDLHFMKLENDEDMSDVISIKTKSCHVSPLPPGSVISTGAWSDIDKLNKIYDSEDSQLDPQSGRNKKKNKKKLKQKEILIQKNVEDIKGLNIELMEISETNKIIRNEKWIKNLMSLEDKSGVKLLKPEEVRQVMKDNKEVKINIDTGDCDNMSSININISDSNDILV